MKTIMVRVESDRDAELLGKILNETQFEARVETFIDDEDVSDEELQILEDRLVEYQKDPSKGKSLEEVKEILKSKHGL